MLRLCHPRIPRLLCSKLDRFCSSSPWISAWRTMASCGLTEAEITSSLSKPSAETNGFLMQQTMYRIKDPKVSLKFYSEVLGMRLLSKASVESMKFTVYFMGYESDADIPSGSDTEKLRWTMSRPATIELTHNWGSEDDESIHYHNGNSDPRGFGHIGISVPDIEAACQRFESLGVTFAKKLNGGKMKGIAFIQDPDGYMIEIVSPNNKILMP